MFRFACLIYFLSFKPNTILILLQIKIFDNNHKPKDFMKN